MLIRLDDEDVVRLGRRERLGKRSQKHNRQQFFHRAKSCRLAKRLAMLGNFLLFEPAEAEEVDGVGGFAVDG